MTRIILSVHEYLDPGGSDLRAGQIVTRIEKRVRPVWRITECPGRLTPAAATGDLLTLALRYKLPEATVSTRLEFTLRDPGTHFRSATGDFQFAASVASFGMLLRGSRHQGSSSMAWVEEIASNNLGPDQKGYRAEFVDLVRGLQ